MQTSFKKGWLKASDISAVVTRFPIVTVALIVFASLISFEGFRWSDETLLRVLGGIIVGCYVCVCETIIAEHKGRRPYWILQILFLAAFTTLGFYSEELRLNVFMGLAAVLLALGNSLLFRKARNNLHLWDFTHKIWTGAAFATLGAIFFTLGILAISAALKSLFDVKINDLVEHIFLPYGLGLLAPMYWLGTVPQTDEDYAELYENPGFVSKAVAFLGTWILAPLTLIYAVILIAYGVKIGMVGALPKGEIAGLTVPFLIVGALTWLLLTPPFVQKRWIARVFRKIWFPVSLPAVLLLGLAVGVRVLDYGLTPERFALVAAVIWAGVIGTWYTLKGAKNADIRIIPGFAAVLMTFGAVFSGWVSTASQTARFEKELKSAGVLTNTGEISSSLKDIDIDHARRAKGAVLYLFKNNELKRIRQVLKNTDITIKNTKAFRTALGIENISGNGRVKYTYVKYMGWDEPVAITGFDRISQRLNFSNSYNNKLNLSSDGSLVTFNDKGALVVTLEGVELARQSFADLILPLRDAQGDFPDTIEPISIYETDSQEIALLPKEVTLKVISGDIKSAEIRNMGYYVLTKGFD